MKKDRAKKVLIRLTEEEKNKLQEMAEEKEMKVEPFIRKTIFSNDIKKLSNENEIDKEKWSKLVSQALEMLDKMKEEREHSLIEYKEKKSFWRRIFRR